MIKKFFFLLLLTSNQLFGQSSFLENFEIGVFGGAALPIGNFSAVNVKNSLVLNSSEDRPGSFRGFPKDKGGQAQIGYNYGLKLTYTIDPSFFVNLNYISTNNSINTNPQQQYYDENFRFLIDFWGNEFVFPGFLTSDNYQANLIFLGFGHSLKIKNFEFSFAGLIGQNALEFPFYSWYYDPILFRPAPLADNSVPGRLNALVYGLDLKASYPLYQKTNAFLSFSYLRSDHPHQYWTLARGASYGYFIEDRIDFRIILANFGIALSL